MNRYYVYADTKFLGTFKAENSDCDEFYDKLRKIQKENVQMDIYRLANNRELEFECSQFVSSVG